VQVPHRCSRASERLGHMNHSGRYLGLYDLFRPEARVPRTGVDLPQGVGGGDERKAFPSTCLKADKKM
jgi:hypothetical protein